MTRKKRKHKEKTLQKPLDIIKEILYNTVMTKKTGGEKHGNQKNNSIESYPGEVLGL